MPNKVTDSVRSAVTSFFISEGILKEGAVGASRNYIYVTEMIKERAMGYDESGIYRVGVHQSHSPEHVLIMTKDTFRIFNLIDVGAVLKGVIEFSEQNQVNVDTLFIYMHKVMNLYQNSQHRSVNKIEKVKG